MLIFFVFEEQFRNAIKLIVEERIIKPRLIIAFQPIDENITDFSHFSPVEKRVFRDSCEYAGAAEIYFFNTKDKLTNKVIMDGINSRFEKAQFER